MNKILLNDEVNPVLISVFADSLHGRKLVFDENASHELMVGYSILYRRFQRSLRRCLKSLADYELRRTAEGWGNNTNGDALAHLDDYLDCVYAAAELYEFYETDVVKFLQPDTTSAKSYRKDLRSIKREATLMCNACKHNHAYMQSIDVLYDNQEHVVGFALYQRVGKHIRLNRDIHQFKEAFSLNWSIRRLVACLMQADLLAAELVSKTEDRPQAYLIKSIAYTLPFWIELKEVCNLKLVAMPKERVSPYITLAGDVVEINPLYVSVVKQGVGNLFGYFDVLGGHLAFELPYVDGENEVNIRDEVSGEAMPTSGFFRISVKDIRVKDE